MPFRFFVLFFLIFQALQVKAELKPQMQGFYRVSEKISPYLIDKKLYLDEKNSQQIEEALAEFNQKVATIKKEKSLQSDDTKFRFKQLAEGFADAEASYKNGFKDYSYWVLKSSFNNCISCHTQKGLAATAYEPQFAPETKNYDKADFLFTIRNYREAVSLFEQIVSSYTSAADVDQLESSVQKLLYYSVRVLRNDSESLALFNRLLQNKNLPLSVRIDLLAWKRYLSVSRYRIEDTIELNSAKEIQKFVEARESIASHYRLSGQRRIVDLETTQKLFDRLQQNPSNSLKPWLFYWLADFEKDNRMTMFDLSAENYLQECIERFSTNPAAKKCLDLYVEIQTEQFTGSRGTDIPTDVKKQVESYRKLLKNK